MHEQEQHEMRIERSHPSGAEEWYCPTCGRRFLMQWPPQYKRVIIEAGDEYAVHTGGKGGLSMGAASIDAGDALVEYTEAATQPLGESESAAGATEDDENATFELSEEMLKPWRAYIEGSQDGTV